MWSTGDRVVTFNGEVGYVEEIDDGYVGVRLQTPDDEASVYVTWLHASQMEG